MSRQRRFQMFVVTMVIAFLMVFSGITSAQGNSDNAFERVKEVQERHTAKLMAGEGVVGTAVGFNEQGKHAVLVFLERSGIAGIPQDLEGVPVYPLVTGKIAALKPPVKPGSSTDPTARFDRPVPIGVSTGNAKEVSAGTIACRVKSGNRVYALSNNHVYARENAAVFGEEVLQPGRYDGGIPGADYLGNLSSWATIDFSGSPTNKVDAAIALTDTAHLGMATPADGYGTPTSATVEPSLNMAVQKYGRTTSLTKGAISGINATIKVTYSSGTATFVGQITVKSRSPFIKAGDSGSLLVTEARQPVGLLFAGDNSGKFAVANTIDDVLGALGVSVDGQ